MRTFATHYAINYSEACDKGGSGICDGYIEDGEEQNPNTLGTELDGQCTCPCHRTDDLPETVVGVKAWHDEFHA